MTLPQPLALDTKLLHLLSRPWPAPAHGVAAGARLRAARRPVRRTPRVRRWCSSNYSPVVELPGLALKALDTETAVTAARLRGASGVGLGDAIHLATAMEAGAAAFLTNDRRLVGRVPGLDVLLLDDLLATSDPETIRQQEPPGE